MLPIIDYSSTVSLKQVDTNVGRICARLGWLPLDAEKALEVCAAQVCISRDCSVNIVSGCPTSKPALWNPKFSVYPKACPWPKNATWLTLFQLRVLQCLVSRRQLAANFPYSIYGHMLTHPCQILPFSIQNSNSNFTPLISKTFLIATSLQDLDDYAPEPEVHQYLKDRCRRIPTACNSPGSMNVLAKYPKVDFVVIFW